MSEKIRGFERKDEKESMINFEDKKKWALIVLFLFAHIIHYNI